MSLRCKRAQEDSDFTLRDSPLSKRQRGTRFQTEGHAQLVSPSVLTDLLSLFPTMDPQVRHRYADRNPAMSYINPDLLARADSDHRVV